MNWHTILEMVAASLISSGLIALIILAMRQSKFEGRMETKMQLQEDSCQKCETRVREDFVTLETRVNNHHESGNHLSKDFRDMIETKFDQIQKQLEGIVKRIDDARTGVAHS